MSTSKTKIFWRDTIVLSQRHRMLRYFGLFIKLHLHLDDCDTQWRLCGTGFCTFYNNHKASKEYASLLRAEYPSKKASCTKSYTTGNVILS